MIRAFNLLSLLFFLAGGLLLGVFGTWQEAAPFWPGAACLWVSALMGVFTLHWRQRGRLSRTCVVVVALFTAYILWRGLNSSVAYLARHDLVFCATAFLAWVQVAARFEGTRSRYALMVVWGLLTVGNLGCGLYQKYVNPQANPLSFLQFGRDTGDAVFGGFFPNSNHLCGFMELTGFFFLAVAVFGRVESIVRVACGIVFASAALNVAFSTSRGGLAFGIGVLIFAGLSWALIMLRRRERRGASGRAGLKFATALMACVAVGWVAWTQLEQKFGEGKIFKNLNGRSEVWGRAYEQWQEAPLMGTGARSFEYYERSYRNMNTQWITWHPTDVDALFAHNDWLQLLADYGLAGLLLGIAVLGAHAWKAMAHIIRDAWEAEPGRLFTDHRGVFVLGALCGIIPFAIHCAADFQMHIGVNAVTAAMVLGMMANPGIRTGDRGGAPQTGGPRAWRAAVILLAAVPAGVMGWKVVPWARGDYFTYTFTGLEIPYPAQDPPRNLESLIVGQQSLRKAVDADPLNYQAWVLLGRAEGAIGRFFMEESPLLAPGYMKSALGHFRKAWALYPQNPNYAMYIAATLDQTNKVADAEEWWERALQWGDGSRLIHAQYADHCVLAGRYSEAWEHYIWVLHRSDGPTRELMEKKQQFVQKLMRKEAEKKAAQPPATNTPPNPDK